MIEKRLLKKHKELERRYRRLEVKYDKIMKKAETIKYNLERDHPPLITAFFLLIIGIIGLLYFKEIVIIELGIMGFVVDVAMELHGTRNGWWKYKKSKIFMIGKVPIEIPFLVFSMGMGGATIVLFLLTFF